jgi:hypothetical protein
MPPPAATQAAARLWTQFTPPFPARDSYRSSVEITRTIWWQTRFTRGRVREWKRGHNSVTVQNRTHVYMNLFDHKDLENHLLQLCPKVVKHPVFTASVCRLWYNAERPLNDGHARRNKPWAFSTIRPIDHTQADRGDWIHSPVESHLQRSLRLIQTVGLITSISSPPPLTYAVHALERPND